MKIESKISHKRFQILWSEVRNSTKNKGYTEELLSEYSDKIKDYE